MEKLSLESLAEFDDGSIAVAVNQAITQCYHDCRDRPGMKKKREVTIKLSFTPDPDPNQGSQLERVIFDVEIGSKCPGKGLSQLVKCMPKHAGFGFHADTKSVDHDPDQKSFDYEED